MSEKKRKISTQQLVVSALLMALAVIFTRVLAVNQLLNKLGLGFAAIALCAMLYGPVWTAIVSALADLIGALAFPTGAYFPGFTLTAAITGAIFGLFLYRKKVTWLNSFGAAFCNCFLVTLVLNTIMINVFFNAPLDKLLATRVPQFLLMLVVQTVVIRALGTSPAIYKHIIQKSSLNKAKKP